MTVVLSVLPVCAATATDIDGNGLDDELELQVAKRFCPALVLNAASVVEPEPVEILSHPHPMNGSGRLGPEDVYADEYASLSGNYLYTDPYCDDLYPGGPLGPDDVTACHNSSLATWQYRPEDWQFHLYALLQAYMIPHFEYGIPGDEDATVWRTKYLSGGLGVEGPGSSYPPTVYAHPFINNGHWVIQYWIFYPYNDWVLNHEGDWEHINVILSTDLQSIEDIDFYIHQHYYTPSDDHGVVPVLSEKINIIDGTHPVIYVGGSMDFICLGNPGSGDNSGASFPAPGRWANVGANTQICGIVDDETVPGQYIPYSTVSVEWIPQIQHVRNGGPGCGLDYFLAHPEKAWMRTNMRWGHIETDIPGWADAFGGNQAPYGPRYHSTWESRTVRADAEDSDKWSRYYSITQVGGGIPVPYPMQNPEHALFVEAESDIGGTGLVLTGLQVHIEDLTGGTQQDDITPKRYPWRGATRLINITAPDSFSAPNGDALRFERWKDAAGSDRTLSLAMSEHTAHAVAIYVATPGPELMTPRDNYAGSIAESVMFGWEGQGAGATYELQIASNPEFIEAEVHASLAYEQFLRAPLELGVYYWRVRFTNGMGTSAWSSISSLVVLPLTLAQPQLRFPSGGQNLGQGPTSIQFDWDPVNGATSYWLQLSTNEEFTHPLLIDQACGEGTSWSAGTLGVGKYFWRLRARDSSQACYWKSDWFEITQFTNVATEPIRGIDHTTRAVSVADFNGDGNQDIYIVYEDRVLEWSNPDNRMGYGAGDGTFVDVAPNDVGATLADGGIGEAVAAGDIDNDGLTDLYVANGNEGCGNCPNVMAHNLSVPGQVRFVTDDTSLGINDSGSASRAELVDLNNDGLLDLYLARRGAQPNRLYVNVGAGRYAEVVNSPLIVDAGEQFAFGDYDGDRFQDVVVAGKQNGSRVYRNTSFGAPTGTLTFTDATSQCVQGGALLQSRPCFAWSDYDNDGDIDLFVGDEYGQMQLWNNHDEYFVEQHQADGLPDYIEPAHRAIRIASWVDYDNDGSLDLFVCADNTHLFRSDSGHFVEYSDALPLVRAPVTASVWFDANNDGLLDCFLGYADHDVLHTYASWMLMNASAPGNAWLHVNLLGQPGLSNRSGLGSTVRIRTNTGSQICRQWCSDTGGSSLGTSTAEFGLGTATKAQLLEVRWPSGRVSQATNVDVNGRVTMNETPVPIAGDVYLSFDPSHHVDSPGRLVNIGEQFTFYLVADMTAASPPDAQLKGFDARVDLGGRLEIVNKTLIAAGSNGSTQGGEDYLYMFSAPVDVGQGAVALIQYTAKINSEGADASAGVQPTSPCRFSDPLEPASVLWTGGQYGGMYRFHNAGGINVPINDVNPPVLLSSGLYQGYNNIADVRFQEELATMAVDGSSACAPAHWSVFKTNYPATTIPVTGVLVAVPGEYWIFLANAIPSGEGYSIRVSGLKDLHGNAMTPQVGVLTASGSGGGTSCPVLFAFDGHGMVEENPLLTACERSGYREVVTDYYTVSQRAVPRDGELLLELRELEEETSYIDGVEVWVVDHGKGSFVTCSAEGTVYTYTKDYAPVAATTEDGVDVLDLVKREDGKVYTSNEAGAIILVFPPEAAGGSLSLMAPTKAPCPSEDPGGGKSLSGGGQVRSGLLVEIEDEPDQWRLLGNVAPRTHTGDVGVVLGLAKNVGYRVRVSWGDEGYAVDRLAGYVGAETGPIVHREVPLKCSRTAAGGDSQDWRPGSGTAELKRGEAFLVTANVGFPVSNDRERTYVVKVVGRYEPGTSGQGEAAPKVSTLKRVTPNPFNPSCRIEYSVAQDGPVRLYVYDIKGRKVRTVREGISAVGSFSATWDGNDDSGLPAAGGLYMCQLTVGSVVRSMKMMLVR